VPQFKRFVRGELFQGSGGGGCYICCDKKEFRLEYEQKKYTNGLTTKHYYKKEVWFKECSSFSTILITLKFPSKQVYLGKYPKYKKNKYCIDTQEDE
jgi:hypothetical protein